MSRRTWLPGVAISVVACCVDIVWLRYVGGVTYAQPERWKIILWFVPFFALFLFVGIAFRWTAARATPGLDRFIKKSIFVVYVMLTVPICVFAVWFLLLKG